MRETIIISTSDLYSSTMDSLVTCLLMDKHKEEDLYKFSFSWSIEGGVKVVQHSLTNISRHSDDVEREQECLKFIIDYKVDRG